MIHSIVFIQYITKTFINCVIKFFHTDVLLKEQYLHLFKWFNKKRLLPFCRCDLHFELIHTLCGLCKLRLSNSFDCGHISTNETVSRLAEGPSHTSIMPYQLWHGLGYIQDAMPAFFLHSVLSHSLGQISIFSHLKDVFTFSFKSLPSLKSIQMLSLDFISIECLFLLLQN